MNPKEKWWLGWIAAIPGYAIAIYLGATWTPRIESDRTIITTKAAEIARLEGEVEALRSIMDSERTVSGAMIDEYRRKSGKLAALKELQKPHPVTITTNHVLVYIVVDSDTSRYEEILRHCQTNNFDQVLVFK